MIKKFLISVALLCASSFSACFADQMKQQFFYAGLMTGYANVDWSSVVSTDLGTMPSNQLCCQQKE